MRRAVLLPLLLATVLADKPVVVNNGAICENKATGFFVMDNTVLSSADSIVYKDYSEDECLKTCSQNRDQLGRSILCSSFVYHHESFSCTIYKDKKEPEGQAQTEVAIGKRYFEKVCLGEAVPIHCADAQFLRVDHFELIGYAVEVTITKTLDECLAYCASNTTCKSALYFYEESECILNTESALSKPDDFKQAQDDNKVIYFQNACDAPRVQVEPTTPPPKNEGSNEREGSADEASSEKVETKRTSAEETTKASSTTTEESNHEEQDDDEETEVENESESESKLEKVEADHETTPATTEENDYDEDKDIEEEEEELRKEKDSLKKLTQKASYLKYEKHPRNFASRTLKANDDEAETDEHNVSHQADERNENEQLSKEEGEEPTEAETKPLKKKSKLGEKVQKVPSTENLQEETYVNYFSEWSDWTPCTKSGERQIRRRKCLDLRKCLGALMQVRNCPAVIPTIAPESTIESVRSLVAVPPVDYDDTDVRDPVPVVRPHPESPLLPAGDVNTPEAVWSPWQGTCQQFASGQPCNDGQMIGFESRECVAKDPYYCEGPFFRYCTLAC